MANYPTGGLSGLLDAYNKGTDISRVRAKETADSQEKQDEFRSQHAPYSKGQRDKFGFATGVTPDEEGPEAARARAYFGLDKDQGPSTPTAQPAPPSPLPGTPAPAPTAAPPPAALAPAPAHPAAGPGKAEMGPGDPKPLIRDPKAALPDASIPSPGAETPVKPAPGVQRTLQKGPGGEDVVMPEGATSMEYDPNDPKVTNKDGKSFVPARKTTVPGSGAGLEISGDPSAAAPSPVAPAPAPSQPQGGGKLIPDAYSLKKLVDLQTTLPRSAAGLPVDVNNLPPDMQRDLGVTDEMRAAHVKIPATIVNSMMGNQTKLDVQRLKNDGASVDEKFSPVLDAVQGKEITAGGAIAMATRLNGGQRPPAAVLKAIQQAGQMGNADRNYKLGSDKFDEAKGSKTAQLSGDYAKKALGETKLDIEAINTLKTVDTMLQRKDTNGLRKLVPLIIERGFVPQRLTNQMASADTGLTDIGSGVDQWITGIEEGKITPENVAFFRSLVHEGQQEHQDNLAAKNYRWKRAGVGALMARGMEEGQAVDTMERALSGNSSQGGAPAQGGAYSGNPTPKPDMTPGAQPKGTPFKATKNEMGFRKEMANATAALRAAGSDPAKQAAVKKMFQERTGIAWGASK